MKLAVLVCAAAVSVACIGQPTRAETRHAGPAAIDVTDPAPVRKAFLARLRRLAHEADLFAPDSTATMLDMKFQSSVYSPEPVACGDGKTKRFTTTTFTPLEPSWYRALPSGAGHIEVPAFTVNPATTTGDPALSYKISHSVMCADYPRLQDHTEARLSFSGLPAFTCLTVKDLQAELPEARYEIWTDGVSGATFEGRVDDDSAVSVTITFRAGARCAIAAEVVQDQEQGLKYRRARGLTPRE